MTDPPVVRGNLCRNTGRVKYEGNGNSAVKGLCKISAIKAIRCQVKDHKTGTPTLHPCCNRHQDQAIGSIYGVGQTIRNRGT